MVLSALPSKRLFTKISGFFAPSTFPCLMRQVLGRRILTRYPRQGNSVGVAIPATCAGVPLGRLVVPKTRSTAYTQIQVITKSIDAHTKSYAQDWEQSSAEMERQGCYLWMATQLDAFSPRRLLDIGCGSGRGLIALISRHGNEVITLDHNSHCLFAAATRLRANRVPVTQDAVNFWAKRGVRRTKGPKPILLCADVLIVDPLLESWLASEAPFDAITVWLPGAAKVLMQAVHSTSDNEAYRQAVEHRAYMLAKSLLRKGGVLHFVDRAKEPDNPSQMPEALQEMQELHHAFAESTTSFAWQLATRYYSLPNHIGVPLDNADKGGRQFLISITAQKLN
jgi:SAM-dependent methyltransferase